MHVLFANTGVQIVCVPLAAGRRLYAAQIGNGWQHCRLTHPVGDSPRPSAIPRRLIPYVQWQIVQGPVSKLLLAVDTTLGDPHAGHFADAASMAGDFVLGIGGLVGAGGEPLAGIPRIELCLRAATATAGEAKPVHMIVDFGNSRTGALLLEVAGEVTQSFQMQPFELPESLRARCLGPGRPADRHAGRPLVFVAHALVQHPLSHASRAVAQVVSHRNGQGAAGQQGSAAGIRNAGQAGPCSRIFRRPGWDAKGTMSRS